VAFVLVNDGNGALDETPSAFYLTKTLKFQERKKKFSAFLNRIRIWTLQTPTVVMVGFNPYPANEENMASS